MSSCQGCRVLRKGCNQDCVLRDCIQWIPNPQSQANATMFLAKFYGRTGLVNLIEPVHPTMRPGKSSVTFVTIVNVQARPMQISTI
ncbi:hypothetical protein Leryth_024888 [Lithospermum erythrorhizon]|nr:hypothetical protein Leryth_024888 [Lithospermum erythrorhizon]